MSHTIRSGDDGADGGAVRPRQHTANSEPVRAKDATARKLFRPECHRPGCAWEGTEDAAFAEANAERQAHLNQHILAAPQVGQHQLGQIEAGA